MDFGRKHRKTPHTGTHPGKRVYVKLIDGTVIIDRFVERNDKYVFLKEYGRLLKSEIKSFSDFKQK